MAYGEIPRTIKFDPQTHQSDPTQPDLLNLVGYDPTNGGINNLNSEDTIDPKTESDAV